MIRISGLRKPHSVLFVLLTMLIILFLSTSFLVKIYLKPDENIRISSIQYTSSEKPEDQSNMIGVLATNGRLGYVHFKDFSEASNKFYVASDSLIIGDKSRDLQIAQAFKEAVNEKFDAEVLSEQDAINSLNIMQTSSDLHDTIEFINSRIISASVNLNEKLETSAKLMDADTFLLIYKASQLAVCIKIPVYESDGVTQIGEYAVG